MPPVSIQGLYTFLKMWITHTIKQCIDNQRVTASIYSIKGIA